MFCADCGGKLYVHRINNGKDIPKYVCGNYAKGSIETTQKVEIHLNFIGEFKAPQPEIDPAVLAEQEEIRRQKEATKDRLHQNYLKRKANGKQKEWEKGYEEKRRARYAEKKAALFAEGAVLGSASLASLPVNNA